MKNRILIIISAVVIVCSFVACSANSGSKNVSTTAVTDSDGATHYYEPVTDENKKIVTEQNGDTVTTGITVKSKTTKNQTTSISAQNKADNNIVNFESATNDIASTSATRAENTIATTNISTQKTSTTTEVTTEKATEKTTQPATDSDGWITKWY